VHPWGAMEAARAWEAGSAAACPWEAGSAAACMLAEWAAAMQEVADTVAAGIAEARSTEAPNVQQAAHFR